jgi:hypothetical protein
MRTTATRPFTLLVASVLAAGLAACGEAEEFELDVIEVADAGFMTPAAVIHDAVADVYIVSNIAGRPGEEDGQGFLSRVSPDGEVLDLRWIDLAGADLPLHSPKGMALQGDTLFVADLTCVRGFDRVTGERLVRTCVEDATWITDVDVGPEGSIFIVDSGLRPGVDALEATGTDAVYRLQVVEGRGGSTLARSEELGHPMGIAVGARGIFVTTAGTGEIFRLTATGDRTQVYPRSGRHFDGIVFLPDGGFAYSSWSDSAIFRVGGDGRITRLLEGITEPGGLGYDAGRNRLLIAVSGEDRILLAQLPDA